MTLKGDRTLVSGRLEDGLSGGEMVHTDKDVRTSSMSRTPARHPVCSIYLQIYPRVPAEDVSEELEEEPPQIIPLSTTQNAPEANVLTAGAILQVFVVELEDHLVVAEGQ